MMTINLTCVQCSQEKQFSHPVTSVLNNRVVKVILPADWWLVYDGIAGSWKLFCPICAKMLPPEVLHSQSAVKASDVDGRLDMLEQCVRVDGKPVAQKTKVPGKV